MNFEGYKVPNTESLFVRITISLFCFLIFLRFIWNKKNERFAKSDCTSANCVRCNKQTKIVSNAKVHFKELVAEEERKKTFKRIENAIFHPLSIEYILYVDGLKRKKIWKTYNLPNSYMNDIKLLEDNVNIFTNDYYKLIEHSDSDNDDKWLRLYMINQGYLNTQLIDMCKKSFSVLDDCKQIMRTCIFGYSYFSILRPGTTVGAHVGSTNVRLRVHIPLIIPTLDNLNDICEMDVDGERVEWEIGKAVIFDDSFIHSVKYQTECENNLNRVVLLVDFWHPDITANERFCIQECFTNSEGEHGLSPR